MHQFGSPGQSSLVLVLFWRIKGAICVRMWSNLHAIIALYCQCVNWLLLNVKNETVVCNCICFSMILIIVLLIYYHNSSYHRCRIYFCKDTHKCLFGQVLFDYESKHFSMNLVKQKHNYFSRVIPTRYNNRPQYSLKRKTRRAVQTLHTVQLKTNLPLFT